MRTPEAIKVAVLHLIENNSEKLAEIFGRQKPQNLWYFLEPLPQNVKTSDDYLIYAHSGNYTPAGWEYRIVNKILEDENLNLVIGVWDHNRKRFLRGPSASKFNTLMCTFNRKICFLLNQS